MSIRADSYSSTSEVVAFTHHLIAGQGSYNSTTRPSLPELEKFIDRASGALNIALAQNGFAPAAFRANSTAKLMADDWVTAEATQYAELTQRGAGYSDADGSRTAAFKGLFPRAEAFIRENRLGIQRIGVTMTYQVSQGLQFTGLDAQNTRSDAGDSSLEQPLFRRGQFDVPKAGPDE